MDKKKQMKFVIHNQLLFTVARMIIFTQSWPTLKYHKDFVKNKSQTIRLAVGLILKGLAYWSSN